MKTALEQFIEWLQQNHPTAVPPHETKEHFFMKEKIDQQMAYNAGFTKAKSIYLDGEWNTLKAVYKSIALSGFGWPIANMRTIWFMFPMGDREICERPKG